MNIELKSIITCPQCHHQKLEEMPLNSCLFIYQCDHCKILIKPNVDNSCIFCSYGSVTCPPVQENYMGHVEKSSLV